MERLELTEKQKELVEAYGVIQENMGLNPASARVNALLTVSNKTDLSFDEIRDTLGLSKSAVSNALNNLLSLQHIGYKTKMGERKRYFFSKLGQWKTKFRKDIADLVNYNNLLKEILKERSDENPDFNKNIEELAAFMDYFMEESIKIIDNWEKK
ncbi:MarR family transcriptional regulator [Zunongwangia sp. F260]|uniref:MarR family transcriptional regulator n=2 Tax=Autumnicola TaxID=3160927 RepID=A0ABU3CYE4_9FLAO|nr:MULTISPECIES: MarR family transcriptional regulator [unclassified Zunongwangia]MDT0645518.1 MarR family transcriptional regulator [Zunongwangia sp. F260]MDT0651389.1 MarR family transcriptional regulator [Zunongwangia sp. F297]